MSGSGGGPRRTQLSPNRRFQIRPKSDASILSRSSPTTSTSTSTPLMLDDSIQVSSSSDIEEDASKPPPTKRSFSDKFLPPRPSSGRSVSASAALGVNEPRIAVLSSELWVDQFRPTRLADVAVAPDRARSVLSWMTASWPPGRLLILSGPAGCGKSTLVAAAASEAGLELCEWVAPVAGGAAGPVSEPLLASLANFLFRASRYASLSAPPDNGRILVLDDLPIDLMDNQDSHGASFRMLLRRVLEDGRTPVVLVISVGSEDLSVGHILGSSQELHSYNEPQLQMLEINEVPPTRLKKAMLRVCKLAGIQPPGNFLEILLNSGGDLRNAIMNLQFTSVAPSMPAMDVGSAEGLRVAKDQMVDEVTRTVDSIVLGRGASVHSLHLARKILRNKRLIDITGESRRNHDMYDLKPSAYRLDSKYGPNVDLMAARVTMPKQAFCDLLHGQYLNHIHPEFMDDAAECANGFSSADSIAQWSPDGHLEDYRLAITLLSLRAWNRRPDAAPAANSFTITGNAGQRQLAKTRFSRFTDLRRSYQTALTSASSDVGTGDSLSWGALSACTTASVLDLIDRVSFSLSNQVFVDQKK